MYLTTRVLTPLSLYKNLKLPNLGLCVELTSANTDCQGTFPENTQLGEEVAKATKRLLHVLT